MRGRESSGIYARGCAVLTSVSLGEPSFAVAPGYGGWDSYHGSGTRCFLRAVVHSPGLLRNTSRTAGRTPAEYMPHTRRIPAECAPTTCVLYCGASIPARCGIRKHNRAALSDSPAVLCVLGGGWLSVT